jgi:hypothetical protein
MKLLMSALVLFIIPASLTYADTSEDQALCYAKFDAQCKIKCQENSDVNCLSACRSDATDQCRKAGQ